MTISIDNLRANSVLALQLIGEECGAAAIGEMFHQDVPRFRPILPTTWESLAQAEYIVPWELDRFHLTSGGFVKALEATGKLCDAQMKRDLGCLCASLSKRLKARRGRYAGPAMVGVDVIVHETGLPHYWVVNAIHCDLMSRCLKQRGACWPPGDDSESVIAVPVGFGLPIDVV